MGEWSQPSAAERAARRRRLAEIFGEVLPETTADERDAEERAKGVREDEAWLRGQVPPHHGA